MPVSIYELDCKYQRLNLKKEVYLIPESHLKRIHIDNGAAYIDGLDTLPTHISVEEVTLSEETSLDERFRFSKNLTFKVRGRKDLDFLDEKYYAIVVTEEDVKYCVNVEFPSTVTYTYTLSQDTDETQFTLRTESNHPTLRLATDISSTIDCKGYFLSCVKDIRLLEKYKSALREGHGVTSSEAFKKVDYLKESITFTEAYNGNNVTTTLSFDIPLSEYKSSWHYNLLEFIYNTYSLILEACGGYHYAGFNFGLEPAFTVNGDGDNAMISIALREVSDRGGKFYVNPLPEDINSSTTYVYTDEHDGYICVEGGLAQYTLQKELNFLGNPTGNYRALQGFEDLFPDLNIVGTFDEVMLFHTDKCGGEGGGDMTGGTLPNTIELQSGECKSFTFSAVCDWHISDSTEDLSITPTSGVANRLYNITVCKDASPYDDCGLTLNVENPTIYLNSGLTETGHLKYSGEVTITGISDCNVLFALGYGHGDPLVPDCHHSSWEEYQLTESIEIPSNTIFTITLPYTYVFKNDEGLDCEYTCAREHFSDESHKKICYGYYLYKTPMTVPMHCVEVTLVVNDLYGGGNAGGGVGGAE